MFDPHIPPAASSRGTVPMTASGAGQRVEQARPKSRIVGKDQPRQPYRDLFLLPDGQVLVGYRGGYWTSPFGLQVRSGPALALRHELAGAAGPFSLRDGVLLASGPLARGTQSSVRKVALATLAVLDTLPVREPYLWLADGAGRLVGQSPAFPSTEPRPVVDPALLDRHPHLRRWAEDRTNRLLVVGPDGQVGPTLDAAAVGPEYAEFRHLALSQDGGTLYAATACSVAAVSVGDWSIRWRRRLGDPTGPHLFYARAMALDAGGRVLAVGGIGGPALVLLEAATGEALPAGRGLGPALGNTMIRTLAWHPSGWLAAGTGSGRVAHLDLSGAVRTYKGAGQGIEALLFLDAGRSLLVCGAEKHFRVWPLLEDEGASA